MTYYIILIQNIVQVSCCCALNACSRFFSKIGMYALGTASHRLALFQDLGLKAVLGEPEMNLNILAVEVVQEDAS